MIYDTSPQGHEVWKSIGRVNSVSAISADFLNLDGANQKIYKLKGSIFASGASTTPNPVIQLNGYSGASDYGVQISSVSGTTLTAYGSGAANCVRIGNYGTSSHATVWEIDLTIKSNWYGYSSVMGLSYCRDSATSTISVNQVFGNLQHSEDINRITLYPESLNMFSCR